MSLPKLLNLTLHNESNQKAYEVVYPANRKLVQQAWQFKGEPTKSLVAKAAAVLTNIAVYSEVPHVLIHTSRAYMLPLLLNNLAAENIEVLFEHVIYRRESSGKGWSEHKCFMLAGDYFDIIPIKARAVTYTKQLYSNDLKLRGITKEPGIFGKWLVDGVATEGEIDWDDLVTDEDDNKMRFSMHL